MESQRQQAPSEETHEPEPWEVMDLSAEPYTSFGFKMRRHCRAVTPSPGFVSIPVPAGYIVLNFSKDAPPNGELRNEADGIHVDLPIQEVTSINVSYPLIMDSKEVARITFLGLQTTLKDEERTIEVQWDLYAYLPGVTTASAARDKLLKIGDGENPDELSAGVAEFLREMSESLGPTLKAKAQAPTGASVAQDHEEATVRSPGRKIKEQSLQLRQIEATERLADEMAENNRLLREASQAKFSDRFGGRLDEDGFEGGEGLKEALDAIPEGMFDNIEW